ncbi:hypothetical protein SEA_JACOREN57_72 [Mycobacterium phage JacoRen57]|nr:hypothetical protein SEA_JACOREN57_72 [Mycobacterium phage JacoRen57]
MDDTAVPVGRVRTRGKNGRRRKKKKKKWKMQINVRHTGVGITWQIRIWKLAVERMFEGGGNRTGVRTHYITRAGAMSTHFGKFFCETCHVRNR